MIVRQPQANNVANSFPQVYRNDAPELVEFTQAYYEHLDSVLTLDYFKITDLDSTYDEFIKFFQRKYLADIELPDNISPRILIKHITDLYKRKGSEESIRLLFKMFFDENIELFYPSTSLLSPSNSDYYFNSYLEMVPVYTPLNYELQKGMRIIGQTTRATAYIEEIIFKNFDGSIVPLIFLSNKLGEFTVDDTIVVLDNLGEIVGFSTQKIAGSLAEIEFTDLNDSSPDNNVGDEFTVVISDPNIAGGIAARVMASEVTNATSGNIKLTVTEGGYGYTIPQKTSDGLLNEFIDAQAEDVFKITYVPNSGIQPLPQVGDKFLFDKSFKYYDITDVEIVPNSSGSPSPYSITIDNGIIAVDEGDNINITVNTDGSIVDGTTVDIILSGLNFTTDDFDGGAGVAAYTVEIQNNQATLQLTLTEDVRTEGLEIAQFTLSVVDSAGTNTSEPSVSVIINDTSVTDGDSITITSSVPAYFLTTSTPIEKDYGLNTPVEIYKGNTVTELFISNQVLAIDPVTLAKFTYAEIADEVERIVVGLNTPSDTTDDHVELWDYLNATNAENGKKNADINLTGSITAIDVILLRNAHNGDPFALNLISDRFDSFVKGQLNDLEVVTYTDPTTFDVSFGTVIKYEEPLLYVQTSQFKSFPEGDARITLQRADLTEFDATTVSAFNASALFKFTELGEFTETVEIVTTTCESFFNNTISDYSNNVISETLEYDTLEIGDVGAFATLDSGVNYNNEAYFYTKQSLLSTFNKYDFSVAFEDLNIALFEGDVMTQQTVAFNGEPYTARAKLIRRENDRYFFRLKSFYQFSKSLPVTIQNQEFNITNVAFDTDTKTIGTNAEIVTKTTYGKGQITKVKILDTGYKYLDGAEVKLVNDAGTTVATGNAKVTGTGFSKGRWRTIASNLNAETRVLQDSKYYQEFSFDVGSSIVPERYTDLVRNTVQVAGTKMFSTPLINTINDVAPDITTEITFLEIKKQPFITESETDSILPRYPEQEITTEDNIRAGVQAENLVTVETEQLTTLTI